MLTQADNITRMKLHFFLQHHAIPHDQTALTWVEGCGADIAVPMKAAVSWKDVSGKEMEIGLWSFFTFTAAKWNVRSSKQVDDKVLRDTAKH